MLLRSSKFILKRVLRDFVSLAILFLMPLALITILGLVSDGAINENLGINMNASVSLSMIIAFQMFAGFYTLELMRADLLRERKWRLKSLPISLHHYVYSIIIVTTIYGGLQSYVLTHYTRIVYGVTWGNQGRLILAILLMSFVIQMIYLNLAVHLKNYKTMERSAITISLVSMFFGGVWFQLPDHGLLNIVGTYGNPYSLAKNILLDGMKSELTTEGMVSVGVFVLLGIILLGISTLQGRRMFG